MEPASHFPITFQDPDSERAQQLGQEQADALRARLNAGQLAVGGGLFESFQTPYSHHWQLPWAPTDYLDNLHGEAVVDLGCGRSNVFRDIAAEHGASAYMGIDIQPDLSLGEQVETPAGPGVILPVSEASPMPSMLVQADLLDVANRLSTGSCSVALNGIDADIIPSTNEYGRELTQQIRRITANGRFVLGVASDGILPDFERQTGIIGEHDLGHGLGYSIYKNEQ